jgi:hypothetical protein
MNIFYIILSTIIVISAFLNTRKFGFKIYILRVLIGLDQLANTLLGGFSDETISARCGRGYGKYWYWTFLGNILNRLDPNHIYDAMQSEINDTQQYPYDSK